MSRRDLAIDLGTSSTRVFQQGAGVVFDEPSLAAINGRTGDLLAVGWEAWEMAGQGLPSVTAVRPLQRGAITNFELAEQMIRAVFRKVGASRLPRPRAMVCVPMGLTPVERRAVEEAVSGGGARSVSLVDEPLAAAIGSGLPIHDPVGSMIVDVGGGTAQMAMLALGAVVLEKNVPVGGAEMDSAILDHLRARYDVAVGESVAERIKIDLGSAYPTADAPVLEVRGRELSTGLQRTFRVTAEEIREVLADRVQAIVEATRRCLAESPPDLAHDVLETGLFLTGGGAMLRGLDMRLAQECEVPVQLTEHPTTTVVVGAGRLLDYEPGQRDAFLALTRR